MPNFTLNISFKIFSSNLKGVLSVWNLKSERHQWKQHIKIRLNTIDFLDKVSAKGNYQSQMGKAITSIKFRILEIVLVPHQKRLHYWMYFSTPSVKSWFGWKNFQCPGCFYGSVRKYVLGTIRSWWQMLRMTFKRNDRKPTQRTSKSTFHKIAETKSNSLLVIT